MKRLLRSTLSTLSYHALRLTPQPSESLRILTYHRVTDAHPDDRLCVPVKRFAEQMRYLRKAGFSTLGVADAVRWLAGEEPQHGKAEGNTQKAKAGSIIITFDDGFEDNFLYAYPAMARYGLTGTFFIPSAFIEGGPDTHPQADRPMTRAQLLELLDQQHEIGAHSVTHVKLTTVSFPQVRREVHDSKVALERLLEHPIEVFCYPSGDYDEEVKREVAAAGYVGACTVEPGANLPGTDPFALRRTEVSAFDTLWDFEKKLAGAYDWLHRMAQRVKR